LEANYRDQLKENYSIVEKGYNSFPTRIPGTAYSKALLVSHIATSYLYMVLIVSKLHFATVIVATI